MSDVAKARVDWVEKDYLIGTTPKGIKVPMESPPEGVTPRGPTPKELALHSLAGCTMLDVVSIILKSRKHLEKCRVDVEAEVADEHPKIYKKIHLTYNFKSPDLDNKTAERAIQLSKEKYCSVTAMLTPTVTITHSFIIEK